MGIEVECRCITNCIGYSLIQGVQCENVESKLVDGRTHNSVEIDHIEKKWQLMLQRPQKVSMIQSLTRLTDCLITLPLKHQRLWRHLKHKFQLFLNILRSRVISQEKLK